MQTPLKLTSRIDAVQVYRRGATVFRRAELVVDGALPDEVELVDLPLSLLDPTVRVRILNDADVVAAGVRVGLWVRPGGEPPKAPEQKELDEVRRKLGRARALLGQLDEEVGLLAGVSVPDRPTGEEGKAPPPSPMAARLYLEQFVDEATRQRIAERRASREEVRVLEEDEQRILERIRASSSAAEVHLDELKKSVVARLRPSSSSASSTSSASSPATSPMSGKRTLTVELSYVVPGARWAPAYQCKLTRDGSRAEIQLRAWVAQRTGEDWRGVKLRLSTASPLMFTELPELSSIKIGRAQPAPAKKGFRPPPRGSDVLFRDFDRDVVAARSLVPAPAEFHAPSLAAPSNARTFQAPLATRRASAKMAKRDTGDVLDEMMGDSAMPNDSFDDESDAAYVAAPMAEATRGYDLSAEMSVARPAPAPMMSAPAPAAPPPQARSPAKAARAGPSAGGAPRPPDDVLMAIVYPLLRLPPPADSGRGKLQQVDVRALYTASLAQTGRPVPFDVMSAVSQAEEQAQAVASLPLPDGAVDADDISSHFDFAYEADGVVEVVADGGFHSVALGDRASEARMRYIAVPREELNVYRVAMLSNPIPAPLLPGPAEVYVGGEYVLTTRLPTVPARGELKLGLGVEQAIKIARNTKFSELRSGEKVVAMSELVHDVDIDIVNHLEREIDIEVRDRVPVPAAGAEVVVEELTIDPPWQAYDQEERGQPIEGGRRWEIKVAKGASQKLKARYVVKIYANNEVVGGNRREQ